MSKSALLYLLILSLTITPLLEYLPKEPARHSFFIHKVYAAEEEEDGTITRTVTKEVIEYLPVQQAIVVTEDAYSQDADGDLLVDALDPDPSVDQRQYFTDDDKDGVPNAIDLHPHEDDFAYYETETDDNNNGIIDSYEE